MKHHAKASSAGSTEAGGNSRGLFRRALATRGASSDAKGVGARSGGRLPAAVVALALAIAALAISAAPASAATPPTMKINSLAAVSYTSVHINGRITTTGGSFGLTNYSFQYSKNPGTEGWATGLAGNISGAKTNETVEGDITGLKGGTKYFVRLVAYDFGPGFVIEEGVSPEPNPEFTTLVVDLPENVSISPPPTLFSTSAELSGKVKRPSNPNSNFNVECHYEYVSEAQFNENVTNHGAGAGFAEGATVYPCAQNPVSEPGVEKVVTAHIGCFHPTSNETYPYFDGPCLEVATTYHVRLVAENSAPSSVIKEETFTTQPRVAKTVILTAVNTTEVSYRTAKVSASIERPAGVDPALDVYCNFESVTQAQFESTGFAEAVPVACDQTPRDGYYNMHPLTTTGPTPVTATLHLKSGVEYHVRLNAENGGGSETKTANPFSTLPGGDPTYTLNSATAEYTTAKVSGTVTRGLGEQGENEELSAILQATEVGTEFPYNGIEPDGSEFIEGPEVTIPRGAGAQNFSYEFSGLKPETEYKFRMAIGVVEVGERTHPSPAPYPTATTRHLGVPAATLDPVTGFTEATANFSGTVATNAPAGTLDGFAKAAYKTEWHIECSPECNGAHGNPIGGTVEAEEGGKAISGEALELHPNVYYEVKLVAHNAFYTVESPVQAFQTPLIPPTVTSLPGVSDEQGGYFLEGIVDSNNAKTKCKFEYGTTATYPNTYEAECLPHPSGANEVQLVNIEATSGQFRLGFRGQTTADLPFNATPAEVQSALRALSKIGSNGVEVSGAAKAYKVTFSGGAVAGANVEPLKGSNGTTPLAGGGGVSVSTETEGGTLHPVSVEAHLEALTPGATYHFRIVATNAGGTTTTVDRTFIPTLAEKGPICPNEELREENSSLALPECRAYEMVTPPAKEGFNASLQNYYGGKTVEFATGAGNISKSGQNAILNRYVAERTGAGWETIPHLNGSSGSIYDAPSNFEVEEGAGYLTAYSSDLRSSVWTMTKDGCSRCQYLRSPDGTFALFGAAVDVGNPFGTSVTHVAESADLSHLLTWTFADIAGSKWGPGVYEFVGPGMAQPRRVDLDNSGTPISTCTVALGNAKNFSVSSDGSRIVNYVYGGCGGANPPAGELWARVNGTTSFDVSASHCTRTATDPGGACNGPTEPGGCTEFLNDSNGRAEGTGCRSPQFVAATPDGSRVFFTTTQQLVNGDTDQTNDIYYCDIPSGNPAPTAGKANPCSAFGQVSVPESGAAKVEEVLTTSADGSTVLFTAKGVLASNKDAFEEQAVAGDENLYVWHQDAAHPAGQTSFVGKLAPDDLTGIGGNQVPQSTPDGRYLVFTTANRLVQTDTDQSRDVYRVDAETGELIRASTNIHGLGGNGPFDAELQSFTFAGPKPGGISDDGQKIVFTTAEPLAPLDGNGESDVYLWTPGRVSLITTGSVGGGASGTENQGEGLRAAIDGSGQDIYFQTSGALTPADVDGQTDVYDARIDGGFSFAEAPACLGSSGSCQPSSSSPSTAPAPATAQPPADSGNVKPCPKGRVAKGSRCVRKPSKKHHKKPHKKAGHKRGGSK